MLRNRLPDASCMTGRFLNEVLSLNAQEFGDTAKPKSDYTFLNEVLSLNAQESNSRHTKPPQYNFPQ